MTGTPNVNKLLFTYHALTLLFLAGFALYDKRHHRIRNAAKYEAFLHIMNNCSGVIREKVRMLFSENLSVREQKEI